MEPKLLTLTSAVPVPLGSDIVTVNGVALAANSFAIRANRSANFIIPFAVAGYRSIVIGLFSNPVFDQPFSLSLNGVFDTAGGISSNLASATLPISTSARFVFGAYAPGQGGVAGGANVANVAHYAVPALADPFPYISLGLSTAITPTAGDLTLAIMRF